jgi:hypothetical protein
LVAQELERAKDFAELALNCDEAIASIEGIMRDFRIEGK